MFNFWCQKCVERFPENYWDKYINITHEINDVFNISDDIIAHTLNQNEHLQQSLKVVNKIGKKDLKPKLKSVNLVKLLLITWDIF